EGVQFHPESIMTAAGKQLLANFLRMVTEGRLEQAGHERSAGVAP
ncbi:MAG: aminodeoxychorismate/anthranilate synthase component II, partial [Deltaproteobacteria bacterium]